MSSNWPVELYDNRNNHEKELNKLQKMDSISQSKAFSESLQHKKMLKPTTVALLKKTIKLPKLQLAAAGTIPEEEV